MASTRGRQVVIPLVNKSGGAVVAGDVVVMDTANDGAFTTTTTARDTDLVGIVQESIATDATGRVLISGYAALVNVDASVTRGHYAETHTDAKQAVGNSARRSGSFGQFLTGGTTPTAAVWGFPDGSSASGLSATIFDAKGDIIAATAADTESRLAVGTNGMALLADSSAATGLAWGNPIKFARSAGSDVSSTSFADTDLVFAVVASSTYVFEFHLYFYTNATTVGLRLAVNGPSGATGRFGTYTPTSAASGTSTTVGIAQRADLDQPIVSTTTGPGVSPVYAIVTGSMIVSTTPGNVTLRHASETATQTIIEAGSWGWCAKVV